MAHQHQLFDADPPEWEEEQAEKRLVATVVFASGPKGGFDYLVPDALADPRRPEQLVEPGRRVAAPFGRGDRRVTGYCVEVGVKRIGAGRKLKTLFGVVDPLSLLSPAMLRLARWMAERHLTPLGQVLEGIVPAGVRGKAGTRDVTLLSLPTRVAARLTQIEVPPKQRRVLETLAASPEALTPKRLAEKAGCTAAPITALRKRGLVESRTERIDQDALGAAAEREVPRQQPKTLNPAQEETLTVIRAALDDARHETVLVHGVTGSGKTEVYIQAIERVVSFGRQAIVLVPEISLTPQTVGRFRERFDHLAVLHSNLSDVDRHRHWRRIAAGEVQVVIGARSAVFAPTPHLGLIVIDEEHENSFKQDTAPRYHARDVAIHRAEEAGVPLVLASATPALESWLRTQAGAPGQRRYTLAEMPHRIGGLPMPAVRTVDMRQENDRGAISRPLHQALQETLRDRGQAILLLNRRGFSTHVFCMACGEPIRCKHCAVAMTYHRTTRQLICHWCDARCEPPRACPEEKCGSTRIRYGGLGTQRLEAELNVRLPEARVARMDADTTRRPGSHEATLDAFRRGESDVLLGTQMIAKGLDFPNVTLVGVVNADAALHFADFRAAERTFQLITQVAGRTGRGERGGRVLVQCFDPDHPVIRASVRHDYLAFARHELPQRESLGYPPFGCLARVVSRGESAPTVEAYLQTLGEALRGAAERLSVELTLLGPAPAPIERLRGEHRYQLLLRGPDEEGIRRCLQEIWRPDETPVGVRAIVDIDPMDMM